MPSRIESGFVPLPKVEQEQPEDRINIVLNLPSYVDQDRIGVNLTGIARLCKLGGIRPLIVIGNTDEETSHVIPEVAGLNSDGSAVASKKIVKVTVPTFESSTHNSSWRNLKIADRWISLNVNMNVDEIGMRASEATGGVHAVGNWTRELNTGLKTPIRRAGNKNLLHDLESGDKFDYRYMAFCTGIYSGASLLVSRDFRLDLDGSFLLGCIFGSGLANFVRARKDPNHRFSIFPGFQLDRAIALSVTSRTRTLIKDLHQDKK